MTDDPIVIRSDMAVLQAALISLISPHPWAKLLMTFRRLPVNMLQERDAAPGSLGDSLGSAPIINYAILFGTNLIVHCAQPSPQFFNRQSIFSTPLTDQELDVAVRVFIWSSLHGFMQYRINTKSREALSAEDTTADLIESYNARQASRYEDKKVPPKALDDMILSVVGIPDAPVSNRKVLVRSAAGREYIISQRNYAPSLVHLGRLEPLYRHLDGSIFLEKYGMPYAKWLLIYRGLNSCLFKSIATLWGEAIIQQASEEGVRASAERANDLSASALGVANVDSLAGWVSSYAEIRRGAPKISSDDVHQFIRGHTVRPAEPLDPFVERSDCFYRLSETVVIWDYIKSAALLPVIRRQMAPLLGATGKSKTKGRTFESLVMSEIQHNLPQARAISGSKKRRENGKDLFELDVGFALDQVLFVVDAKYAVKSRRYMTGDSNKVQERSENALTMLSYLDQQIANHADWLQTEWSDTEVKQVIGIICTAEVEYISTSEPSAWLKPFKVPRACTISQLIDFLKDPDWHQLVSRNPCTRSLPM
ncbi:hypothetical protein SAMN05443254_112222 [Bradyrhizobium sp. OK095]|nr:hypothetical protein SAMN05443254_112222 [Bradyrhizobium sp. OK095]